MVEQDFAEVAQEKGFREVTVSLREFGRMEKRHETRNRVPMVGAGIAQFEGRVDPQPPALPSCSPSTPNKGLGIKGWKRRPLSEPYQTTGFQPMDFRQGLFSDIP